MMKTMLWLRLSPSDICLLIRKQVPSSGLGRVLQWHLDPHGGPGAYSRLSKVSTGPSARGRAFGREQASEAMEEAAEVLSCMAAEVKRGNFAEVGRALRPSMRKRITVFQFCTPAPLPMFDTVEKSMYNSNCIECDFCATAVGLISVPVDSWLSRL